MRITLPYRADLLGTHLMALGLGSCLDDHGIGTFLSSDAERVHIDADAAGEEIVTAIRSTAAAAREAVEADIEIRGLRKPTLIAGDAPAVTQARERLIDGVDGTSNAVARMIAGISTVIPDHPDPQRVRGTVMIRSPLDGAPRNAQADLIRSVMRPARAAAERATLDELLAAPATGDAKNLDGWSPKGDLIGLTHKWLACVGLGLFAVSAAPNPPAKFPWIVLVPGAVRAHLVHRPGAAPEQDGPFVSLALPLFADPASFPRAISVLRLAHVPIAAHTNNGPGAAAAAHLMALGVQHVAVFERHVIPNLHLSSFRFGPADVRALDATGG